MTIALFDAKQDFRALLRESLQLEILHKKIAAEGWPTDDRRAWVVLSAMAASIGKCYAGMEQILKNLLDELDGAIPPSQDWAEQLIVRAGRTGPHGRPALFNAVLVNTFHDLRAFRLKVSETYVSDLNPEIVHATAAISTQSVRSFGECLDFHSSDETNT